MEINNSTENGLFIKNSTNNGIRIYDSDWWGINVDTTGWSGVCIKNTGTHGLDIYTTGQHGIQITGATEDGVHVASASEDGIDVNTLQASGEWGVYTPDKIHGSNVTMRTLSMYGYNDGSSSLKPGDVVALSDNTEAFLEGPEGQTVMKVRKAGPENSEALIGVVEYKVTIETQTEKFSDGSVLYKERFAYAGEGVGRGEYLSIVVYGIADVNINSHDRIRAGQKLTASEFYGAARPLMDTDGWSSGILGKALESSNGRGSMKVFVNCK